MSDRSIAVVDDDSEILDLLKLVLSRSGFSVDGYPTPGRFFDGILKRPPALCIIDVQLPGMDGREIIRVLRAAPETKRIPLIAISATARDPRDVIKGLDNGASEYFAKPLDLELLVARVENLLARSGGAHSAPAETLTWGKIVVTPDEHVVELGGKTIALTNLEFKLLLAFLRQPNRVLARSWLLETVWQSPGVATRTVDKHVEMLRKKLPPLAPRLETVVGVGYLFRPQGGFR